MMKRVKFFISATFVAILVMLFIFLKSIGYIDYLRLGSSYFIQNEKYFHSTYLIQDEYFITINLNDLEQYKDQYVLENDLFKISMSSIRVDEESNIALYFYVESQYNFKGGKIVYVNNVNNYVINDNKDFNVTTNLDGITNTTKVTGEGPFQKEGYGAGIYINFSEDVNLSEYDEITLTITNLMINNFIRQ